MRTAGRLAASVLEMIGEHVEPGVTTEHLDRICHDFIVDELDCVPAPLNYTFGADQPPFPKVHLHVRDLLQTWERSRVCPKSVVIVLERHVACFAPWRVWTG